MSLTDVHAFIERLQDEVFRNVLLLSMAGIAPGDWEAVVRIARAEGYEFTSEELKQAAPPGFFKGAGRYPEVGWERSTLDD
jgi:hypothetical protein